MIAIALFCICVLFSYINGQLSPTLYSGLYQAPTFQEPFLEQSFLNDQSILSPRLLGVGNGPLQSYFTNQIYTPEEPALDQPTKYASLTESSIKFNPLAYGNSASVSKLHEIIENSPQQQLYPRSIIESQYQHLIPNNLEHSELTKFPQNLPAFPKYPQTFETLSSISQNSPLFQRLSQISQNQFQKLTQSLSSASHAATPTSSAVMSPSSSPRSIPSPLTLTDTIPLPYLQDDFTINTFDVPEPILKSSVGCLDLTVTPYGTISETPLPDPSVSIPRSPFFPASSPVSALAPPLSPLLPSASPAVRGNNFLRKVPVPPPFI